MRISERQLAEAMVELLNEKKKDSKELEKNFFQFLSKKHWLSRSPKIMKAIESYIDEKENRLPVTVTTAHELPSGEKKKVETEAKKFFPEKQLTFSFKKNSLLLGGIRIETENMLYDATLGRSLQKLSQHFAL